MPKKIDLILPFNANFEAELEKVEKDFVDYRILGRSLDARNAPRGRVPKIHYQVELIYTGESFTNFFETKNELTTEQKSKLQPVIVGLGPAGLFAALRFLDYGIPVTIVERGAEVHRRMLDITKFWRYGTLQENSNVCFGEGGAGLFSDGKLITRIKSPFIRYVMQRLVDFGAPEYIAYESNPHLGSNKMRRIIAQLTNFLKQEGCTILYNTALTDFSMHKGKVTSITTSMNKVIKTNCLVMATGHSAKDIYYLLERRGIALQAKDFAVGVRVEHPRREIDRLQYGPFAMELGAARYRLSYHNQQSERGCFSFCMCPGGYVLSSGTDHDGLVTNGMSNFHHNSKWSNSALIVSVKQGVDFAKNSTFSVKDALTFQQDIEQRAFSQSMQQASGKELPAVKLIDFMQSKHSKHLLPSSTPSGVFAGALQDIFPTFILEHLKEALEKFDRKMPGFVSRQAMLLAPETRTSSCVTILRDRVKLSSPSCVNLYPCGEGAGYAGGITSSAVDGIKVVESIVSQLKE